MPKYKHLNQELFDQVKLLLKAKLKVNKIAKLVGKNWMMISFINKSDDLKGYKSMMTEYNQKRLGLIVRGGSAGSGGSEQPVDDTDNPTSELREIKKVLLEIHTLLKTSRGFKWK